MSKLIAQLIRLIRNSAWPLPWVMPVVLIGLSGCQRINNRYDASEMLCGQAPLGLSKEDSNVYRPVGINGATIMKADLKALWIKKDGSQIPLDFNSKGCVFVSKNQEGSLSFVDKAEGRLSLVQQTPGQSLSAIHDAALEKFPALTAKLSCSGQDIWTNEPFVQVSWEISQAGNRLSQTELQKYWPLLQLRFQSRNQSGVLNQELAFTHELARKLQVSSSTDSSFPLQINIAAEQDSSIELHLQDLLDRTQVIDGGAACKIHMSSEKPPLYSFVTDDKTLRINRGQTVHLEAPIDSDLYMQVAPLTVESQVLKWEYLSEAEKDLQLKEFRSGRLPVFWEEGSYLMRAFTLSRAGNRSPVWERVVQVNESTMLERKITPQHWVLTQLSQSGRAAVLKVGKDELENRPTIWVYDLGQVLGSGAATEAKPEAWHPEISQESLGLFESGFGINRQVIEGRFGFGGSTRQQFCLSRGSNPGDAFRAVFQARILCWERQESSGFKIVLDQEAPFWNDDELTAANYFGDASTEILAYSSMDGIARVFKLDHAAQGLARFVPQLSLTREQNRGLQGTRIDAVEENADKTYLYWVDSSRGYGVLARISDEEGAVNEYIEETYGSPVEINLKQDQWGTTPKDDKVLPATYARLRQRLQVLPAWTNKHFSLVVHDGSANRRWAAAPFIKENQTLAMIDSVLWKGLPSSTSDICYFYPRSDALQPTTLDDPWMDCLAFGVDVHQRSEARIFRYNKAERTWIQAGKIDLSQPRSESFKPFESPRAVRGITIVPSLEAYRVQAAGLNWAILPLEANETRPDWEQLSPAHNRKLRQGKGPLELWGNDQRFAAWLWQEGQEPIMAREIRFSGPLSTSADLGQNMGLVDLRGDGRPHLVQALSGGFASLDLTDVKASWKNYPGVPAPSFVRENPLGWNGRSISLLSGRLLPDIAGSVLCYVARASGKESGKIACYGYRGPADRVIKLLWEADYSIEEREQVGAIKIADSAETAIARYSPVSHKITVQTLNRSTASAPRRYEIKTLPWVATVTTKDENNQDKTEVKSTSDTFTVIDDPARNTLHLGSSSILEEGILHFTTQLQLGPGESRFAVTTTVTGETAGGRLRRAPIEELSISINESDLDFDLHHLHRINLFNAPKLDWPEAVDAKTVINAIKTRGFYANTGATKFTEGLGYCIGAGFLPDGSINAYYHPSCGFFAVQTPSFFAGLWNTLSEYNEAYITQPDMMETHWTYPFWINESSDPARIPGLMTRLYTLRVPKNLSRDGWQVQASALVDMPLSVYDQKWEKVRDFSLQSVQSSESPPF